MAVTLDVSLIIQSILVILVTAGLGRQMATNRKLSETQAETAKILAGLKQQMDDHEKHCQFAWTAHDKIHFETKEANRERFEGIRRAMEAK